VNADAEVAEIRELGLDASATLVDLGAGTGLLALAAARICRRVIAVDVSLPMIERMEDRATELGLTNLECVHGGFLTYEHRGSLADMVYSRNALHHLPDFWKGIALARVASILRSRGVFVLRDLVYSFDPTEADAVIGAWLSRAPDQPTAGWTAAELATHVREEYSTYSWLLEPMLLRAGFDISEAEYSTSRTFARYVCIKR
jgi:ubiquinone/menaquinone biosynthesis C-methylase UbiE